jgi:hypothetical protein
LAESIDETPDLFPEVEAVMMEVFEMATEAILFTEKIAQLMGVIGNGPECEKWARKLGEVVQLEICGIGKGGGIDGVEACMRVLEESFGVERPTLGIGESDWDRFTKGAPDAVKVLEFWPKEFFFGT